MSRLCLVVLLMTMTFCDLLRSDDNYEEYNVLNNFGGGTPTNVVVTAEGIKLAIEYPEGLLPKSDISTQGYLLPLSASIDKIRGRSCFC